MKHQFVRLTAFIIFISAASLSSAAPGDLDSGFAAGGKFTFGFGGAGGPARGTALQADGKLLVVGEGNIGGRSVFVIRRYNIDGSRDESFGGDGEVFTDISPKTHGGTSGSDGANSVALQADGKFVVAGTTVVGDGDNDFAVVRYHSDGSLDESFGTGGKARHDLGTPIDSASSVKVRSDGKILVAGYQYVNNLATYAFVVARLNADGKLDGTFAGTGYVSTPIADDVGTRVSMAIQADGKIVVAGSVSIAAGIRVVRYTENGALDPMFGGGTGKVHTVISASDVVSAVAIQPGNNTVGQPDKIVVGGSSVVNGKVLFCLARYNHDGTPDSSFDTDGKLTTALPNGGSGGIHALGIESRGILATRIVVAGGITIGQTRQFAVARYNLSGTLDSSFGGGIVATSFRDRDQAAAIALTNGKIVVAGDSSPAPGLFDGHTAIARYNSADGSLDTTFGAGGKVLDGIDNILANPSGMALQPDGKMVLGGSTFTGTRGFAVARLQANGSFDRTFDGDGKVILPGAQSEGLAVALQPDGKILLAGKVGGDIAVVRFDTAGAPDPLFGSGGVASTFVGTDTDVAQAIATQGDGKIVVAGYGTTDVPHTAVVRFNENGTPDDTFDFDGKVFVALGSEDDARAVLIQPDGKIVIAGALEQGQARIAFVARLNTNGSFDRSFHEDGIVHLPFAHGLSAAKALAIDSAGRLIVAGFASNGTDTDFALARLTPDGQLDQSFHGGGIVLTPIGVADDGAAAVALQPDGRIVLSGNSTPSYKNEIIQAGPFRSDCVVARYNPDGSPDTTYGDGGKVIFQFGVEDFEVAGDVALDGAGNAVVATRGTGLFGIAKLQAGPLIAPTPNPTPTATPTATPMPNRFANISTRLRVETGENVLIGGFIVTASTPKRIIIRALGPSLPVEGVLANPVLELFDANGQFVASNDNWQEAANRQEIIDSTIAPPNEFEAAILRDLELGAYTAVVRDAADGAGVGLIEIYDLGPAQDAKLANISTRGRVLTGDSVMIGGLILTGSSAQKVIIRAIGPSLPIDGKLEDPLLELFDGNGTLLSANDNWKDAQQPEIEATTIPPSSDFESAIVASLPPAAYTAVVRGANDSTGVALVEAYALE